MKYFLLMVLIFISNQRSWAILPFDDAASPEFITSARALALGNSYMSKVDDAYSAFYNPAGLGTVRNLQIHLTNIHLEMNNGFMEVAGDGPFSDSIKNYQNAFKATELRTLHADNPGNISHARFHTFPNITYRGITVGYMYSQQNRARLKTLTSDFEISERTDSGPVIAFSASLMGGIIKLGVSAVHLTRKELQKDFASADPVTIDEDVDYKKGSMTHLTGGLRITLPYFMLPTISAVIRNSSNTKFDTADLGGAPEDIPQTVDYSFSLTPHLGRTVRLHFELGLKDSGNRYEDVPSSRKVMGGFEIDYMRSMFVRFGFGDGWGSGGIGVRNKEFQFDLTTYAVEASDDGVREEEDRRSVMSISAGF